MYDGAKRRVFTVIKPHFLHHSCCIFNSSSMITFSPRSASCARCQKRLCHGMARQIMPQLQPHTNEQGRAGQQSKAGVQGANATGKRAKVNTKKRITYVFILLNLRLWKANTHTTPSLPPPPPPPRLRPLPGCSHRSAGDPLNILTAK